MSDHKDRRKEPRKKVMTFTPVHDLKQGRLLGYLRNLTLQGMLIISERTMEVDTQTTLKISLPIDLPGISDTHLTISARVARCIEGQSGESPISYEIGFEFTNIQPEQTQIIESLLARYHFRYKSN